VRHKFNKKVDDYVVHSIKIGDAADTRIENIVTVSVRHKEIILNPLTNN